MAPTFIPEIISVFLTTGVVGLVIGLVFWGIRRVNREVSNRRLRRKLSAAAMAKEAK